MVISSKHYTSWTCWTTRYLKRYFHKTHWLESLRYWQFCTTQIINTVPHVSSCLTGLSYRAKYHVCEFLLCVFFTWIALKTTLAISATVAVSAVLFPGGHVLCYCHGYVSIFHMQSIFKLTPLNGMYTQYRSFERCLSTLLGEPQILWYGVGNGPTY